MVTVLLEEALCSFHLLLSPGAFAGFQTLTITIQEWLRNSLSHSAGRCYLHLMEDTLIVSEDRES